MEQWLPVRTWDRRDEQPGQDGVLWHAAIGNLGKVDFGEENASGRHQSMGYGPNQKSFKGDLISNSADVPHCQGGRCY